MKIVAITLVILMLLPVKPSHADQVVVEVVQTLVAVGAGIAATALTGNPMIGKGVALGILAIDIKSPNANQNGGSQDQVPVIPPPPVFTLQTSRTDFHTESPKHSKIKVSVLRNGSPIEELPSGYSLVVSSSNGTRNITVSIYKIANGTNTIKSLSSSSIINSNPLPPILPKGTTLEIRPSITETFQSLAMNIMDINGNSVYKVTDYTPEPGATKPFYWKGIDMNLKSLPEGPYNIYLQGTRDDGLTVVTNPHVITIKDTSSITPSSASTTGTVNTLTFGQAEILIMAASSSAFSTTINIELKKDDQVVSGATASESVDFAGETDIPIVNNLMKFNVDIYRMIDGVSYHLKTPRFDKGDNTLVLSVNPDDKVNGATYKWNLYAQSITLTARDTTQTFSLQAGDQKMVTAYIVSLKLFEDLLKDITADLGIDYKPDNNALALDSSKWASGVSVTQSPVNSKLIRLSTESSSYDLDPDAGALETIQGSSFTAGTYTLDTQNIAQFASDTVKTSSITTMANINVLDATKTAVVSAIVFAKEKIAATVNTAHNIYQAAIGWDTTYTPMTIPEKPDFIDITWRNQKDGILKIEAKGPSGKAYLVMNNGPRVYSRNLSYGNPEYTATRSLKPGFNKINVIYEVEDSQASYKVKEVETGDATVYWQPTGATLILLEPRDRMVVGSKEFGGKDKKDKVKVNINVRGYQSNGSSFSIASSVIEISSIPSFVKQLDLAESQSLIDGIFNSQPFQISVIGAYIYEHQPTHQKYILQKGDIPFAGARGRGPGGEYPFDYIPFDPDHNAIYTGGGFAVEAMVDGVQLNNLTSSNRLAPYENKPNHFQNGDFLFCAQYPKLMSQSVRDQIAKYVIEQVKDPYLYPLGLVQAVAGKADRFSHVIGKYDKNDTSKYYCSSLAFSAAQKYLADKQIGISEKDLLFPSDNPDYSSIPPGYLSRRMMYCEVPR